MSDDLNIEELYSTFVPDDVVKESFEVRTVATGRYTFTPLPADCEVRRLPDAFKRHAGAPVLQLKGQLTERLEDGAEKRRGRLNFDVTWEALRSENGKLEGMSKLYNQLASAVDMKGKAVGEINDAAKKYPTSIYVREAFKTAEGWKTARTAEERSEFRKAGYTARNFVDSISKVAA